MLGRYVKLGSYEVTLNANRTILYKDYTCFGTIEIPGYWRWNLDKVELMDTDLNPLFGDGFTPIHLPGRGVFLVESNGVPSLGNLLNTGYPITDGRHGPLYVAIKQGSEKEQLTRVTTAEFDEYFEKGELLLTVKQKLSKGFYELTSNQPKRVKLFQRFMNTECGRAEIQIIQIGNRIIAKPQYLSYDEPPQLGDVYSSGMTHFSPSPEDYERSETPNDEE